MSRKPKDENARVKERIKTLKRKIAQLEQRLEVYKEELRSVYVLDEDKEKSIKSNSEVKKAVGILQAARTSAEEKERVRAKWAEWIKTKNKEQE